VTVTAGPPAGAQVAITVQAGDVSAELTGPSAAAVTIVAAVN
jgi:hypothetical protein